jgi:hypothetical protein
VLHIVIALPQHSGKYECEAANRAGSVRDSVTLIVDEQNALSKALIAGKSMFLWKSANRVARFSCYIQRTKTGKKLPKYHKIHQMVIKCSKRP